MVYFRTRKEGGQLKVIETVDAYDGADPDRASLVYRGDLTSMADAEELAEAATRDLGETFIATDAGEWVHPRYDVVRAPKVGDPISYSFNGDTRPCGHIMKIGGTNFKTIYSDLGHKFNRRRQSGSWIMKGGTWCMVKGHHNELNPHF